MLYLLIGVSVLAIVGVIALLLWAVRSGQYDDMEGPAWRVLMDDDAPRPTSSKRDSAAGERDAAGSRD